MSRRRLFYLFITCLALVSVAFLLTAWAQEPAVPADTGLAASDTALSFPMEMPEERPETWLDRFKESGIVDYFIRGGSFMYPLLLTSIIGLAVIIERAYTLSRASTDTKKLMSSVLSTYRSDGVDAARRLLANMRGPIAAVLHGGLMRADRGPEAVEKAIVTAAAIETSFLERGLIWLASVANIAPLLGFLGTVSGMIHAFEAIAAAEYVSAKLVSSGIAEALITTATGLIIAIPTQLAYNYFVQRVDKFVVEMEESSADLLDALAKGTATEAAS